ncbi:MAG: hypothetical protein M3N91_05350 [Pseudomonadota bacterium]|nr:hypothetical protein [Pseudomonadota bacterium]
MQQSLVERAGAGNPLRSGASGGGYGKSGVIDRPGADRPPQPRNSRAELFTPPIVATTTVAPDPCAPPISFTLLQCERTGVTAAQYNSGSIPQGTAAQLSEETSGNTALKPEQASTYGANNILDKDPPVINTDIVSGGAANTYSIHDMFGRQLFVAFTAKF